ncbi:hypothetical protein FHX74_000247 [Friedmanniella endophytica]|uniref:Polyketide cyclase / dehydrase and lipid transport n=1 Tax=Microlunatus kandeliicorticis TaxID=1759536 RepID=A0A7W3IP40_9ACTN|nr:SRPBCC family protein [Microlunatus kandeliicorticis]MBA8792653.1 hypothetical protein [Microlunatus kandeliicorticis]
MNPAPHTVRRSGLVPAPVEDVFEVALSTPLPELYRRRWGPMPPIVSVRDQQGEWTTPGQTRIFRTADGGEFEERCGAVDRPHGFANRLTVLRGPFAPLVGVVEESWSFRPQGTGTEATWEWNLYPKAAPARLALPVVGRLWRGYAGAVLAQLVEEVARRR